jgi:3-hydroxymyristoyl/3-hydroxydecanoyl-(acyl carrier protein) dehydratase
MRCVVAEAPLATWRVPREHPIFAGHFPGMPLVPGVMLLEWTLAEVARALGIEPHGLRIRESKFLVPLRPGDEAALFVILDSPRLAFRICRGTELLASGVLEKK